MEELKNERRLFSRLRKNKSKLLKKSIFKPSLFVSNLLISRSIKRTEQAYYNIQKYNDEFYNQGNKPLCSIMEYSQYCACSCEKCRNGK